MQTIDVRATNKWLDVGIESWNVEKKSRSAQSQPTSHVGAGALLFIVAFRLAPAPYLLAAQQRTRHELSGAYELIESHNVHVMQLKKYQTF